MFVGMGVNNCAGVALTIAKAIQTQLHVHPNPICEYRMFSPKFQLDDFSVENDRLNTVAIMSFTNEDAILPYDVIVEVGNLKGVTFKELQLVGKVYPLLLGPPFFSGHAIKVDKNTIGRIMNAKAAKLFKL